MFSVEIVDEDIGVEVGVIVVGVHQPVLYLASAGVLGKGVHVAKLFKSTCLVHGHL